MAEKTGIIGGLVGINRSSGIIENCYSAVDLSGKGYIAGGFAGNNEGKIVKSYCVAGLRSVNGGFAGEKCQGLAKCYFVGDKQPKNKLWDADLFVQAENISGENVEKLGFDTQNVWETSKREPYIRFISEKWIDESVDTDKKVIYIKNDKELIQFAKMINSGDKRAMDVVVKLTSDIDLGGIEWEPIGFKRVNSFAGIFDGNGHTIRNFVIKNGEIVQKGFFGYLRGSVYNLTVDCQIKGGGNIGVLAACNEGLISCCAGIFDVSINGKQAVAGGLAAQNIGTIRKSYAAGNIRPKASLVIPAATIFAVAAIGFGIWIVNPVSGSQDPADYNPIAQDPDQKKTDRGSVETTESAEHTLSFQLREHLDVSLTDGECIVNFVNPESDDYNIVVELQISDEDAIKLMGGTGRPEELQTALESADDYDPKTGRVTIAASGSVSPGYALEKLKLSNYSKINLESGEISGYIVLVPFDSVTNERALVQSELPVTINLIQ